MLKGRAPIPEVDHAKSGISAMANPTYLAFILDWHETHVRAGDGFADGSSIDGIVLAALAGEAIQHDELGHDQPEGMAVLQEKPRPVVRAGKASMPSRQGGNWRLAPTTARAGPWV